MKISELQKILSTISNGGPDLLVLIDGYEGGMEDLVWVCLADVKRDQPHDSWTGPHEFGEGELSLIFCQEDPRMLDENAIILAGEGDTDDS